MLSQPDSALSKTAYADDVIDLMYKLMEYRNQEIRHRLEKVGRATSMLHRDVLLLIYHFAKVAKEMSSKSDPMLADPRLLPRLGARIRWSKKDHQHRSRRAIKTFPNTQQKYFH